MEQILTRHTTLIRNLLGRTDDRVTNRTFRVSFKCTCHILAEGNKAICDTSILYITMLVFET